MTRAEKDLGPRFRDHVLAQGMLRSGGKAVIAVSGGADSVVLAHLLRFTPGLPALGLVAAHVDHGWREESGADADWVRGLASAWGIEFRATRLAPPPRSEEAARELRYAFLEDVRMAEDAAVVMTAHHADDQAETVLFRAVRGSGLAGLQGIRERRAPRVWRPLLPFTRSDLRTYARAAGLTWREDSTNEAPFSRIVLRREVLPRLETAVAPGTHRALSRLARLARDNEEGWKSLLPGLFRSVDLRPEAGGWSVDREALLALHPAVRARLLRAMGDRLGRAPGETGTRLAVEFTSSGVSGASVPLAGDVRLTRNLDRLRIERSKADPPEQVVVIGDSGQGSGKAVLGGRPLDVRWSTTPLQQPVEGVVEVVQTRFPLTVRGWRPGDRVALPYGTKKLKKLFLEARVPRPQRHRTPVLVNADGVVLWVPGVYRPPEPGNDRKGGLFVRITDAESD